jgi:hypothetical protein
MYFYVSRKGWKRGDKAHMLCSLWFFRLFSFSFPYDYFGGGGYWEHCMALGPCWAPDTTRVMCTGDIWKAFLSNFFPLLFFYFSPSKGRGVNGWGLYSGLVRMNDELQRRYMLCSMTTIITMEGRITTTGLGIISAFFRHGFGKGSLERPRSTRLLPGYERMGAKLIHIERQDILQRTADYGHSTMAIYVYCPGNCSRAQCPNRCAF